MPALTTAVRISKAVSFAQPCVGSGLSRRQGHVYLALLTNAAVLHELRIIGAGLTGVGSTVLYSMDVLK